MAVKVEFSINTVELEGKYLYNHLNAAAICLRTSATQFIATTSISTLEPITGCKSETAIPQNIDGSCIGKTVRRSGYSQESTKSSQLRLPRNLCAKIAPGESRENRQSAKTADW